MNWLFTDITIYRYELIGYYILIITFGVLGSIGWAELARKIKPMKLSKYISIAFKEIRNFWISKEFIQRNPIKKTLPHTDTLPQDKEGNQPKREPNH